MSGNHLEPRRVQGTGEADEGRIRVRVSGGLLESVRLESRLLRSPDETLAEGITDAINAALTEWHARKSADSDIPSLDPNEIARSMREVYAEFQADSHRARAQILDEVADLRRDGLQFGEVPTLNLDDVLENLTEILGEISADVDYKDVVGTGEAARGTVRAVCVPDDRLDSLSIEWSRIRGTVDLERAVAEAVNAALERLRAAMAERRSAQIDPQITMARLKDIQDRNLARLQEYTQAMSQFLSGAGPAEQ